MAEYGTGTDGAWDDQAAPTSGTDPGARPVVDELRQLIAAGREFASAEIAYQSARAGLMAKALAWIAGAGGLAMALLFFVLMALVVGLLLALGPLLGPWGALGAVVGGLLIVTLLTVLVGWLALRRFLALLRDGEKPA